MPPFRCQASHAVLRRAISSSPYLPVPRGRELIIDTKMATVRGMTALTKVTGPSTLIKVEGLVT